MRTKRIPLVGSITTRNNNPLSTMATKDQAFINCYPTIVKNTVTGEITLKINKRPGLSRTGGGGDVSGAYALDGIMWTGYSGGPLAVFLYYMGPTGAQDIAVYSAAGGLQIGSTITGTFSGVGYLSETTVSNIANLVILAKQSGDGLFHAYFCPESGAWTEITDGQYPINNGLVTIGNMAHMSGWAFVMCTNGQIWNSDLNSLSSWSANNFITAQSIPDGGAGVIRNGEYIIAFGRSSMEFYENAGNPTGSPLRYVKGATRNIGVPVKTGRWWTHVGDYLYFIGVDGQSGKISLYKVIGTSVEQVSDTTKDSIFSQYGTPLLRGVFVAHGMNHIVVSMASSAIGDFCYCVETNFWWEFPAIESGVQIQAAVGKGGISYLGLSKENETAYLINSTVPVYQDDGSAYTAKVRTQNLDFGTRKRKFFHSLELVGDKQTTSGNTEISWSDDDYITTSTPVNIDMSTSNTRIYRCGMATRRSFTVTDSVNRPWSAYFLDVEYSVGES